MKAKEYITIMKNVLNYMEEGIHVIDKSGKTIIYNKAMENLEMMKADEVMKKPFLKAFKNLSTKESTMMKALEEQQSTLKFQQVYKNSQGKEITTINSTMPVKLDGELIAVLEIANNVTNIHEMSNTILELQKNIEKPEKIKNKKINKYRFENIVGENSEFKKLINTAKKAAKTTASVFIYGETGTGKELFAQSIHFDGIRREKPFIAQNCAAIPEALLEGLLFGTAKGGFTGAIDREGLFEQANGGTLFLDEINSMPYELQAKLLRVLQEGYIRRVGGNKDIPIDVRIIASTNEPPEELIENGKIRKDLYYRLNVIKISIPPLRKRSDDILILADRFVNKYNEKYNKEIWLISDKAKEKLKKYSYPGNVRELENIIMGAIAMADDEHVLTESQLNLYIEEIEEEEKDLVLDEAFDIGMDKYFEGIEKKLIREALRKSEGNISKAAEILKIKRQTLQHKIKKYNSV